MDLTQLIFTRLSSNAELTNLLTKYKNEPAIFNTEFPGDQRDGWEGKNQYPRISYQINMQVDAQRASSGVLRISVYTLENPIIAEQIESLVRSSLEDVLMKPDSGAPVCVAWARSDPYLLNGNAVICKQIAFDILEYPRQETTDPDPVMALSSYIKELFDGAKVLGIDEVGDFTNPSEMPIFYCRLDSISLADGPCQNTVMWFNAVIAVHLICPDATMRLKMIAALNQRIAIDTEIIMYDESPMTVEGLRVNNRADYVREGQLVFTGYYGTIRDMAKDRILNKAIIKGV